MLRSLWRHVTVAAATTALVSGLVLSQTRQDGDKAQTLPPGLVLKDPINYDVKMTTTFAVPAGTNGIDKLSVWHALPGLRPWSKVAGPAGTSKGEWSGGGKQQYQKEHDSHHVLWSKAGPLKPNAKFEFHSQFTVRSVHREFVPDKVEVQWKDYQQLGKPSGKGVASVHPAIAEAADKIKASFGPSQAVMEFSKWIKANLKYDASVSHDSTDVASTLKTRRGHCSHRYAVFQQFCTHCGIPVRGAAGLTLYAPDGRDRLAAIRSDYSNIHSWAEVHFPRIGWIEVDPGGGDKAYAIPAEFIQTTWWLQSYAIWIHEDSQWKMPTWTFKNGKYSSDYGVEHRITFTTRTD